MILDDDSLAKVATLVATARGSAGVCLLMAEQLGPSNPMLSDTLSLLVEDLDRAATDVDEVLKGGQGNNCDHCDE